MKYNPKFVVLYHIFYEDTLQAVQEELKNIPAQDSLFIFNLSDALPAHWEVYHQLHRAFPGCHVSISSNIGKDVGGKLLMLSHCINAGIQPEWFVLLHDKKSLQALTGSSWKKQLLRILEPEVISELVERNVGRETGIIAAQEFIKKDQFQKDAPGSANKDLLIQICNQYGLKERFGKYVAGTMFWVRASAYIDFFKHLDLLSIRCGLERGNVLDNFGASYTHSWERLLSWVVTNQGYKISGI